MTQKAAIIGGGGATGQAVMAALAAADWHVTLLDLAGQNGTLRVDATDEAQLSKALHRVGEVDALICLKIGRAHV